MLAMPGHGYGQATMPWRPDIERDIAALEARNAELGGLGSNAEGRKVLRQLTTLRGSGYLVSTEAEIAQLQTIVHRAELTGNWRSPVAVNALLATATAYARAGVAGPDSQLARLLAAQEHDFGRDDLRNLPILEAQAELATDPAAAIAILRHISDIRGSRGKEPWRYAIALQTLVSHMPPTSPEAEAMLRKALALETPDSSSPRSVAAWIETDLAKRLGTAKLDAAGTARRVEAADLLRKALATDQALFGDDSYQTYRAVSELAAAVVTYEPDRFAEQQKEVAALAERGNRFQLVSTGRRIDADERALIETQRIWGPSSPQMREALIELARASAHDAQIDRAITFYQHALGIEQNLYGEGLASTEYALGVLLGQRDRLDEALVAMKAANARLRGALGDHHSAVLAIDTEMQGFAYRLHPIAAPAVPSEPDMQGAAPPPDPIMLAQAAADSRNYAEAETQYRIGLSREIEDARANRGPFVLSETDRQRPVARVMEQLADVLRAQGKSREADDVMRRAAALVPTAPLPNLEQTEIRERQRDIQRIEQQTSKGSVESLVVQAQIVTIALRYGDIARARTVCADTFRSLHQRITQIADAKGKDAPTLIMAYGVLGDVAAACHEDAAADAAYEETQRLDALPRGPFTLGYDPGNYVKFLMDRERFADAERVLRAQRNFQYPYLLAEAVKQQGRYGAAAPLFATAKLGADTRSFADRYTLLLEDADNERLIGHPAAAELLYQDLVARLRQTDGARAPYLYPAAWYGLASILTMQRRLPEATALLLETINPYGEFEPPEDFCLSRRDPPPIAGNDPVPGLLTLARTLIANGQADDGTHAATRALSLCERHFGPNDQHLVPAMLALAAVSDTTQPLAKSEGLVRHALSIEEKMRDSDPVMLAQTRGQLAQLLEKADQYRLAEPILTKATDGFAQSLGPTADATITSRARLGDLRSAHLGNSYAGYRDLQVAVAGLWQRTHEHVVALTAQEARELLIDSNWVFVAQLDAGWKLMHEVK